jgi:hypothetical protein
MHHFLGFRRGQSVELTCVAICNQDMHPCSNRAIDDWGEAGGSNLVLCVKGRHQNPGNSSEGLAKLGVDRSHFMSPDNQPERRGSDRVKRLICDDVAYGQLDRSGR